MTTTLTDKWAAMGDWSPLAALKQAASTRWLVDGVIPSGSINWMVAAPESFKTFLGLDLAACIASGRPWHGRETAAAVVLYIAAEGGSDIHIRRAAADLAAGDTGPLCIVQARPRLDEATGLATLLALVQDVTGGYNMPGWSMGLAFPEVEAFHERAYRGEGYLTPDERIAYNFITQNDEPDDKTPVRTREAYAGHLATLKAIGWDDTTMELTEGALRSRLSPWDAAMAQVYEDVHCQAPAGIDPVQAKNVFLVIDTYSQTSADDAKGTVSKYIKTLRDLQEKAAALGGTVTVLVVDHTTKSGESYMGSLAKEGDSDTMMEVVRHGQGNSFTVKSAKLKQGPKFLPIHLRMAPITLDGFNDAMGRPLTSLVVVDGEKAHQVRQAVGANRDTAAATLLALLEGEGAISADSLRRLYTAHPSNAQKNAATVSRSFQRALAKLTDTGAIAKADNGDISLPGLV